MHSNPSFFSVFFHSFHFSARLYLARSLLHTIHLRRLIAGIELPWRHRRIAQTLDHCGTCKQDREPIKLRLWKHQVLAHCSWVLAWLVNVTVVDFYDSDPPPNNLFPSWQLVWHFDWSNSRKITTKIYESCNAPNKLLVAQWLAHQTLWKLSGAEST